MSERVIGQRLFADGLARPVYEDERGQFIVEDGERVDGVWLLPEDDGADTPLIVPSTPSTLESERPVFLDLKLRVRDGPGRG
jgi:hypothetical protein